MLQQGIVHTRPYIFHLCEIGWRLYDKMDAVPEMQSCEVEYLAYLAHRKECEECSKPMEVTNGNV